MKRLTAISALILLALIGAACEGGSVPLQEEGIFEPPATTAPIEDALPEEFDMKDFEDQVSRAPRCSEVAFMVAEIASVGCLSDDGQTLFAFIDFGCGAYSDHGGGIFGEAYEPGAVFIGCP